MQKAWQYKIPIKTSYTPRSFCGHFIALRGV